MRLTELGRYLQLDSKDRWIITFGKYKGSFLDDVASEDSQYVKWFLNQDIPEQVREILEEVSD